MNAPNLNCMKSCSKCGIAKNETDFYKEKRRPVGTVAECKECVKLRTRIRNLMNAERRSEINRRYRKSCKSGLLNFHAAQRRASKLMATPAWLTPEQKLEIKRMYDAAKSKPGFEVDHIIPLKAENMCGLHVPWNLQILDRSSNRSKRNKVA